jgi:hypothetical protein
VQENQGRLESNGLNLFENVNLEDQGDRTTLRWILESWMYLAQNHVQQQALLLMVSKHYVPLSLLVVKKIINVSKNFSCSELQTLCHISMKLYLKITSN